MFVVCYVDDECVWCELSQQFCVDYVFGVGCQWQYVYQYLCVGEKIWQGIVVCVVIDVVDVFGRVVLVVYWKVEVCQCFGDVCVEYVYVEYVDDEFVVVEWFEEVLYFCLLLMFVFIELVEEVQYGMCDVFVYLCGYVGVVQLDDWQVFGNCIG